MNELDAVGTFLMDCLVYAVNGLLVIFYWLAANAPAWVSLLCAGLIAWLPDAEVQQRAGFRPRRNQREPDHPAPRTAQALTGLVCLLWLVAQWEMGAPVPWIGAVMWVAGLLVILAVPAQRFQLLWYVKAGLAMYALTVLGSRLYLSYTANLSPEQWAALIGSTESAAAVIAGTRSNVTTIFLWALWLVVPLGYFSMLVQQVFVNPMSLTHPWAGAQDLLRAIRSREWQAEPPERHI